MGTSLNEISSFALAVEKLGIVGILAIISVAFIYLYIKQSKENAKQLENISKTINELLAKFEKSQERFFELLMDRERRHRGDDSCKT